MFEEEVRREYHLTKADRIKDVMSKIEVLEKILSTFK